MERTPGELTQRLGQIYSFLDQLYSANWELRFRDCQYMKTFAQPRDIENFISANGKFESIAGHVWMMGVMNYLVLEASPNLKDSLDLEKVTRIILFHDLREVGVGDTPAHEIIAGFDNEDKEKENLAKLLSNLPKRLSEDVFAECEAYEVSSSIQPTLEILYVRLLDTLQSGNCVLTHGHDFAENSLLIEATMKKRTVQRARMLIDKLLGMSDSNTRYRLAAGEVDEIARFQFDALRLKGATLDFSEFGF